MLTNEGSPVKAEDDIVQSIRPDSRLNDSRKVSHGRHSLHSRTRREAHSKSLQAFVWSKTGVSSPLVGDIDGQSAVALPALEFLNMKTSEVMPVFSQMQPPNLRHVVIGIKGNSDPELLRTHGAKIQYLEVERATVGEDSMLTLCPYMVTLTCRMDSEGQSLLGSTLRNDFKLDFLQKIVLTNFVRMGSQGQNQHEKNSAAFFQALVNSHHIPALREVCIHSLFEWPTSEHTISKCAWVEFAEMLLPCGIKITDKTGTEWLPRLKASRS
ncbi:hypothetical protein FB451DRAFT_1162568 [Mycena latifolia]|nr:hypothetical protein FB451DRAFT_1162568 [Mycena latifolia]